MELEKYIELKKDLEIYFSNIIKARFKEHVDEHIEFTITPEYLTHKIISKFLKRDGLDVYGMNVNMDGFELLLDFEYDYTSLTNFPFTRLKVDFENNGNYSVYLDEASFNDEWTIHLEDHYKRYLNMNEVDFSNSINEIKKTHLLLILKS